MLIKAADDRQPDIDVLTRLLGRPDLTVPTRRQIDEELRRVRAGVRGEGEAAYEIEFHFGANPNRLTIHDLRLEVDGRVAQIDHLIIDRVLDIWVCESKNFREGLAVDEFGEWVGFHDRRPFGIASPIEPNRKHVALLQDAFAQRFVDAPTRLGIAIKPTFRSVVLVATAARITRPRTKAARERVDGLDSVVKVDQLKGLMDRVAASRGLGDLRRLISERELERVARQLAALDRPVRMDWAARFGLAQPSPAIGPTSGAVAVGAACQVCARHVSQAVIDFCRDRAGLFGDRILCMDCQHQARRGQV